MHLRLFEGIEGFLQRENKFIDQKGNIFKIEVKQLMALSFTKKYNSLYRTIQGLFRDNMYKYRGFNDLLKFIKKDV